MNNFGVQNLLNRYLNRHVMEIGNVFRIVEFVSFRLFLIRAKRKQHPLFQTATMAKLKHSGVTNVKRMKLIASIEKAKALT